MRAAGSKLSYSFYELGTSPYEEITYPAVGLDLSVSIGATISNGKAFAFGKSVAAGVTELKSYLNKSMAKCPNTNYVLSGYSQGAMVITETIPELNPDKILYVATFGDPKLYLPEGSGLHPDACKGKNLSPYRRYAPNCRTSAGFLGAKIPYQEPGWEGKIGLWCRDKDLICGAGIKFTSKDSEKSILDSAFESHTSYISGGQITDIARTIVKKLPKTYPNKFNSHIVKTGLNSTDVVFLIDETIGADSRIRNIKPGILSIDEQLKISPNGRTGLYSYSDYNNNLPVWHHLTLNNYASMQYNMASIRYLGETADNTGEISLLHALKTVLKEQPWQASATKAIIVITDNGYRDPDIDGTTLEEIISLSLSIDPVNIYFVGPEENREKFRPLTEGTDGRYYNEKEIMQLSDLLANRPPVNFPFAEYIGKPGEEFEFTAEVSGDIAKYEWDLDFDGIFETTTNSPTVTKSYQKDTSGFIRLKVTTTDNKVSTGSAKVSVLSEDGQYYFLNYARTEDGSIIPSLKNTPGKGSVDLLSSSTSNQEGYLEATVLVPNCGKS